MKWLVLLCTAALLGECGGGYQNAAVAPGQNGNYASGIGIYQRLDVYRITGTVLGVGTSIQRPQSEGGAVFSNGYGSAYVRSDTPGKGFLRLKVEAITWTSETTPTAEPLISAGDAVLLKTSDTKAASLVAGDRVVMLCREQAEFVEAVAGNEVPTEAKIVRELDYCRMETPQIRPAE